jgi:hypothetical protein
MVTFSPQSVYGDFLPTAAAAVKVSVAMKTLHVSHMHQVLRDMILTRTCHKYLNITLSRRARTQEHLFIDKSHPITITAKAKLSSASALNKHSCRIPANWVSSKHVWATL